MKINLNRKDLEKFYHLLDIKEVNLEYSKMCLDFVNSNILTSYSDLRSLKNSFFNFLEINEKENKVFIDDYKIEFIKIIPNLVLNNPYYKNIKINPSTFQNLSFSNATYKQYQPFIYDDISIDETDYKEIIRIGYFEQEIAYPTLNENNTIWMSLIPHEILTMEKPIKSVKGNVLVLGLGMGYFAYMISNKEDVSSITIIENNLNLINFFNHHLLSQFKNKQKIKIEFADALTYLGKTNENFEYIFLDTYHNAFDGILHYLKIKQFENTHQNSTFLYWIENTLISLLRRIALDCFSFLIVKNFNNSKYQNLIFDKIFNELLEIIKNQNIKTYNEIHDFLTNENLKRIAKFINI